QLANTEVGRLIALALLGIVLAVIYQSVTSARFNNQMLKFVGNTAAAIDRNTAQLKAQDSRIDGYAERDFAQREQYIVATAAHAEVMREYAAAFLELRAALTAGVTTSLEKHDVTHGTLSELKGAVETMRETVASLDSKITQELQQPLTQIVERLTE